MTGSAVPPSPQPQPPPSWAVPAQPSPAGGGPPDGPPGTARVRRGPGRWSRALWQMVVWQLVSLRLFMVLIVVVQILVGAGLAVGVGLLRPHLPTRDALYLSTGAVVMTLTLVGLVLAPQLIAGQKQTGTYDFMAALPVPRTATAAGWAIVTVLVSVPGMVAAVAVSAWRYHLAFQIGWMVLPAVLATTLTATLAGYALGHGVGNPVLTGAATQVLVFVLLGFSPVNFPADSIPVWLREVHQWLPFEPMGVVVRGALTPELPGAVGRSYAVLGAWLVALVAVNALVLGRRG